MTITTFSRIFGAALLGGVLAITSAGFAQGQKNGSKPAEVSSHDVSLRLVHKDGADTIEAYNANADYDAILKFVYQKASVGAKTAEAVEGREKIAPNKPVTIVNGGSKFKILKVEIKDVELRSKMM